MMANALAHLKERLRRLPHLARTARSEFRWKGPTLAEGVRRFREPQHRTNLIAQEQDRYREQNDGGTHHPHQEDMGIGGVSLPALGHEPQDGVVELDADLHMSRLANGVDP